MVMEDPIAAQPETVEGKPLGEPAAAQPAIDRPSKAMSAGYTAVVFFHGMGSQRRYGEMSNFLQELEEYDRKIAEAEPGGWFKNIQGNLEESRNDPAKNVAFIELGYAGPDPVGPRRFRFYEAYWAPATAGGVPMYEVLWWLVRQTANPLRGLGPNWRSRIRYRVATLYELLQRPEYQRQGYTDDDVSTLMYAYDQFESSRARDDPLYRASDFSTFHRYLAARAWEQDSSKRIWGDLEARQRCLQLARVWHRFYFQTELSNAAVLISLLVVLLTAGFVLGIAVLGLILALPLPLGAFWSSISGVAAALITIALTLSLAKGFFQDYIGDVVFWTSYEETHERYKKRAEILDVGFQLLRHVLADDACRRVVVVAHSLGTAVAYETLMDLGRYNRARAEINQQMRAPLNIDKIEYFITYGSPIDKIYYFFQNNTLDMHRYQRVLEGIRGDINQVPLSSNNKPHIHWINFWDLADIISGALQTPQPLTLDRKIMQYLRVDNHQVCNGSWLPLNSHVDYTRNPEIRAVLYDCIFKRKHAFFPLADPAGNANPAQERPDYRMIGSSRDDRATRRFHKLALAICWIAPLAAGLIGLTLTYWFQPWIWRVLMLAPVIPIAAALRLLIAGIRARWAVRRVAKDVRALLIDQRGTAADVASPAGKAG
jgi:hypothetical protein